MINDRPLDAFSERRGNEFIFLARLAGLNTVKGQEFISQRNKLWHDQRGLFLRADMNSARLTLDVDPRLAAHSLVAMALGLPHSWLKDSGHPPRDRVAHSLTVFPPALFRYIPGSPS